MPTVFHSMKLDSNDGMPLEGQSATTLGIRQSDFDIDPVTMLVAKNGKGTSVSPSCSQLPQSLRPRKFPGGLGWKNLFCFKLGTGVWQGASSPLTWTCFPTRTTRTMGSSPRKCRCY